MHKSTEAKFDELCIVNKDGSCKYWRPEAFGYAENDNEAPLDKFFPEAIKSFINDNFIDKKVLREEIEGLEIDTGQTRIMDDTNGVKAYNLALQDLKEVVKLKLTDGK